MARHTEHATIRAQERYGVVLTAAFADELLEQCRNGRAMLCAKAPANGIHGERLVWAAKPSAVTMIFVTSGNLDCLISFLPPDHFKAGNARKAARWRGKSRRPFPKELFRQKCR